MPEKAGNDGFGFGGVQTTEFTTNMEDTQVTELVAGLNAPSMQTNDAICTRFANSTLAKLVGGASLVIDLADAGFDFKLVSDLAKHGSYQKEAIWLGVCTTIALTIELVGKVLFHREAAKIKESGSREAYVTARNDCAFMLSGTELAVFFLEDTTTLFIWWRTGTFGSGNSSEINLYLTIVSAIIAAVAFAVSVYVGGGQHHFRTLTSDEDPTRKITWVIAFFFGSSGWGSIFLDVHCNLGYLARGFSPHCIDCYKRLLRK